MNGLGTRKIDGISSIHALHGLSQSVPLCDCCKQTTERTTKDTMVNAEKRCRGNVVFIIPVRSDGAPQAVQKPSYKEHH